MEKAEVEVDREQVMNEMREGKKEQEDLLVLLADHYFYFTFIRDVFT